MNEEEVEEWLDRLDWKEEGGRTPLFCQVNNTYKVSVTGITPTPPRLRTEDISRMAEDGEMLVVIEGKRGIWKYNYGYPPS